MGEITAGNIIWVCLNALWSLFLIIFTNRHQKAIRKEEEREREKKEQNEFKQKIKSIPQDVIQVIKKGLAEEPLATELIFISETDKRYNPLTGENDNIFYHISFGSQKKQISKELYDKEGYIEKFLVNNGFSLAKKYSKLGYMPMILSQNFLDKIKKWG